MTRNRPIAVVALAIALAASPGRGHAQAITAQDGAEQAVAAVVALIERYEALGDGTFRCRQPRSPACQRAMARRGGEWVELQVATDTIDRSLLPRERRIDLDVLSWRARLGVARFLDEESAAGRQSYGAAILQHTGDDADPATIHALGLAELARLDDAMDALVRRQNPDASLPELLEAARTDPRLYARSADELRDVAGAIAARIDAMASAAFDLMPTTPFSIEVPRQSRTDLMAFYSLRGRPLRGVVTLNPDPTQVPLFLLEALLVHEAVPGHHLQQAITAEGDPLPRWRRGLAYTAFVEGWGLYAESLGAELGIYRHPLMEFGRLNLEMWRALRLVVDTGIHQYDWEDQRAIELFRAHTALPERQIQVEVMRYRRNPGQAVAYKIGEQRFLQLRRDAETRLGPEFDLAVFHRVLLENGPLPMRSLSDIVDSWIEDLLAREDR